VSAKRTALILITLCASALSLYAQQAHTLSFKNFYPSHNGQIRYFIEANVPIYKLIELHSDDANPKPGTDQPPDTPVLDVPPDPPPNAMVVYRRLSFAIDDNYWYSPRGLFKDRPLTLQQALARGFTQAMMEEAETASDILIDREIHPIVFSESSVYLDNIKENPYSIRAAHRVSGAVILNVSIPNHQGNSWALKITSALGDEKSYPMTLAQGQHKITINDIEAGNVLVCLLAADPNGAQPSSYFQEAYALVRKNEPAQIDMWFAEENAADRYRIAYLGVGQNSQSVKANLPLQRGVDAMIRIMAYDAWGAGGRSNDGTLYTPLQVSWSSTGGSGSKTINTAITGRHVRSGRDGSETHWVPGPVIPAGHIQTGLTVTANLYNPRTNQLVDTKTVQVEVRKPRKIYIHGYDVRPVGGSGVVLARNNEDMKNQILTYVNEVFPHSEIEYEYEGKIWVPNMFGAINGYGYLASVMLVMDSMQGMHQTDLNAESEHLYLGIVNSKYSDSNPMGIAYPGYRGMAVSCASNLEGLAYTMAHEMGHCFGLEHAPSEGASSYFLGFHLNRVDDNFPYGGGGMAGGWGYSKLGNHFLSEESHTVENNLRAHWDLMAYIPFYYSHTRSRFSDYCAGRLLPQFNNNAPVLGDIQISGTGYLSGTQTEKPILFFGPDAAYTAECAWSAATSYDTYSTLGVNGGNIQATPLDYQINPNALTADPDSPEPPIMIVTRVPRLKGINVDK
jgi:hypothetical protein